MTDENKDSKSGESKAPSTPKLGENQPPKKEKQYFISTYIRLKGIDTRSRLHLEKMYKGVSKTVKEWEKELIK